MRNARWVSLAAILCAAITFSGCRHKRRVPIAAPPSPAGKAASRPAAKQEAKQAKVGYTETGIASWYGHPYHGRPAANGEIYDMEKLVAAHRTLPFDTWLRVINLSNQMSVEVRVIDRGPFVGGRIIDLSHAAARQIELIGPGVAKVRLEVTLDFFLPTYDQNRAQIDSLRTALLLPNAVLQWTNDAVGVNYVNQTAALVSDDLPEEWGEYHQSLHLVFSYYEQAPGGAANNVPLTFSKEGGAAFTFDVVNRWQHAASVERFSTLRKQRRETRGKIHVEGQVLADGQLPLAQDIRFEV